MKIILLLISIFTSFNCEKASPLDVEIYELDNGLTVILNEDNNETSVFGAVVVDGGSKRDPKDATGIAHYLEHLLFKGTTEMGTIDYQSEKKYLDSIEVLYDKLGKTIISNERLAIQKEINQISIKAADYAIPNEFDRLIESIGGTGLNAGTGDDFIYYFNSFPATQIEKWMDIYSHRFLNPVFRLFQAELEIVYEEKNRSMDNPSRAFYDKFQELFFKNHPYGQQSRIGTIDHLKNPSLKKMKEYYDKFYVANNMSLIISGDFNKRKVKKIIKEKFGRLRSGAAIEPLNIFEDDFNNREVVDVAMLPYRIARMGYRTVKPNHNDAIVLDVIRNLFNNSSRAGLLDKLNAENKILSASASNYIGGKDLGGFGFSFVPKDDSQTFDEAENLIINAIEKIKRGDFSDDIINSVKLNMKMSHETSMESMSSRLWLIMSIILEDIPWQDIKTYPQRIDKVSKNQIIEVANKYFNENYLILRSGKGEHKKVKIQKPPFKPVAPKNTEKKSSYAQSLEKIKPTKIKPRFIDFNKDVSRKEIKKGVKLFHVENPINTIFSLKLQYGIGTIENPTLSQSAQLISLLGTKNKTFDEFKGELQKIGSKIEVYSNDDYFGFNLSGFDDNFSETLVLLNEFISEMHVRESDHEKLKKIIESSKIQREREFKEPSIAGRALKDYVMYGKKSPYLRRNTLDQINQMKPEHLVNQAKKALKYELDIFYTGKINLMGVSNEIISKIDIDDNLIISNSPQTIDYRNHSRNKIFMIDDPKAVQSQIYFIADGKVLDLKDRALAGVFNKYFGTGMASILFQEIREFRSLAYTAYGVYANRTDISKPGYYLGYIGTQVDKTMESISTYMDLFKDMPEKANRIGSIKDGLTESINTNKPGWRNRAAYVSNVIKQGYNEDPNRIKFEVYNNVQFENILEFYNNSIDKEKICIAILTDKSKINIDKLLDYGEIIDVKKENIFN